MISSRALLTISLSFLSACATASGTFVPLGPDHPANALAPAAPITDPSAVLRAESGAALSAEHSSAEHSAADSASMGAFVCPMHPEVSSSAEGRCPKCGMKLVARESQEQQDAEEHPHVH